MWEEAAGFLHSLELLSAWEGVDLNLAITSTSVDPTKGWTLGVDPGEAGSWVGEPAVLNNENSTDFLNTLRSTLGCQLTCWDNEEQVPSDPSYGDVSGVCDMPDAGVTTEYLDCLCRDAYDDPDLWWNTNNICYSGTAQHMESAALALCRAVDDPPDACWDHLPTSASPDEVIGTNAGFLRDGTQTVVVVFSDAGDQSQRFETGEAGADDYVALFEQLGLDVIVAVTGPVYICDHDGDGGISTMKIPIAATPSAHCWTCTPSSLTCSQQLEAEVAVLLARLYPLI